VVRGIDRLSKAGVDGPPDGRADIEGAGSRSRLELRLERLPAGHPSALEAAGRAADARGERVGDGTPDRPPPDEPRLPGGPTPDAPRTGYYERIPQFELMWSWHQERWPERPRAGDGARPDDPPGSWRGDGDRFLSAEHNAEADRQITAMQSHEKGITETLKRIENDNTCGGTLVGLEHSLKGAGRIKEKLWDKTDARAGLSMGDAAGQIKDAVRYTFQFEADVYVRGYAETRERLESAGCRMTYGRNGWLGNPEYRGVNTRWVTSDGGRFELQFHTPESLDAKENRTHRAYERLRSPSTSWAEEEDLRAYQHYVSAAVPRPVDIENFRDHEGMT
jgi:hypothetical protein